MMNIIHSQEFASFELWKSKDYLQPKEEAKHYQQSHHFEFLPNVIFTSLLGTQEYNKIKVLVSGRLIIRYKQSARLE